MENGGDAKPKLRTYATFMERYEPEEYIERGYDARHSSLYWHSSEEVQHH